MRNFKFLIGFPIGVTMLLLSYIFVYFVDGQGEFLREFNRLTDINVLINQVFVSGALYIIYAFFVQGFCNIMNKRTKRQVASYKDLIYFLYIIVTIILGVVVTNIADFEGDEVIQVLIGLGIILLILISICYCIVISLTEYIINKKLKEKNCKR